MALSACGAGVSSRGRELAEHGTAMFPVACYHDDLAVFPVPWHWHDEMEAFIVTEGAAVVGVEGRRVPLGRGEGCFVNSGVLHAVWMDGADGCRLHSVVFHPRLVGAGIDSVFWLRYIQPLIDDKALKVSRFDGSAPWHPAALQAVETTWQSVANEPTGYEFQARYALSQLVVLLTAAFRPTDAAPSQRTLRDDARIKQMLQYIHAHYAEEVSVGRIAQAAAISESECLRCFRHAINTSPILYVKQFRIQKAAELLTASALKTADVGSLCGFQDASYFTKSFRESMGCTPTEYRERFARTVQTP